MEGCTIYIRKIANGYTVSRQIEGVNEYSHSDTTYCPNIGETITEASRLIENAERDHAAGTEPTDTPF